jgi:CRP-like cAMP-binding protein
MSGGLYLIYKGEAKLVKRFPGVADNVEIDMLTPGDCFGEATVLKEEPMPYSVVATMP